MRCMLNAGKSYPFNNFVCPRYDADIGGEILNNFKDIIVEASMMYLVFKKPRNIMKEYLQKGSRLKQTNQDLTDRNKNLG